MKKPGMLLGQEESRGKNCWTPSHACLETEELCVVLRMSMGIMTEQASGLRAEVLGGKRWILSHRLVEMEAIPPFLAPWGLGAVESLHRLGEADLPVFLKKTLEED